MSCSPSKIQLIFQRNMPPPYCCKTSFDIKHIATLKVLFLHIEYNSLNIYRGEVRNKFSRIKLNRFHAQYSSSVNFKDFEIVKSEWMRAERFRCALAHISELMIMHVTFTFCENHTSCWLPILSYQHFLLFLVRFVINVICVRFAYLFSGKPLTATNIQLHTVCETHFML
jgi:hypothetical protein